MSEQDNHHLALPELQKAFDMSLRRDDNPSIKGILTSITKCYDALYENDGAEAEEYFLKAIEYNVFKAEFYIYYGGFLGTHMKNYDKALDYFMKAINIEPNRTDHYYGVAKVYRDHVKDYKESEKYYLKCFKVNNEDCGTNGSYGYLLYLMGRYEEALEYILKELKLDDDNYFAHYYHALVNKALENDEEAEDSLKRTLSLITKRNKDFIMKHLVVIDNANIFNVRFHQRFKKMVQSI